MATNIADLNIEDAAKEFAGNWREFDSFAWHEQPDDAKRWGHFTLSHRDSDNISKSNEQAIETIFSDEQYANDVRFEQHGHWAVGHVSVLTCRVYDAEGGITPAFEKLFEIAQALADYPILDEELHSQMDFDDQHEAISDAGRYVADDAPDDWVQQVWDWLWDGDYDWGSNENWVSDEDVAEAALNQGFLDPSYAEELFPDVVADIEQLVQSDAFHAGDLDLSKAPDDWAAQVVVKTKGKADHKAVAQALEELGLYYTHSDEPTLPGVDVEPEVDDNETTPEEEAIERVLES
jgi:hypothetical protein